MARPKAPKRPAPTCTPWGRATGKAPITAIWAEGLTREAIWAAIQARRTYALTGDNIRLAYTLNGAPLGSVLAPTPARAIEVSVEGGSAIDYVEVLHNNRVIERRSHHELVRAAGDTAQNGPYKVQVEGGGWR